MVAAGSLCILLGTFVLFKAYTAQKAGQWLITRGYGMTSPLQAVLASSVMIILGAIVIVLAIRRTKK